MNNEVNSMISWTKGSPSSNWALRIIDESRKDKDSKFEKVPENYLLGASYAVLRKEDTSEFEEKMKEYPEYDSKDIQGIVCGHNGVEIFLVESTETRRYSYYIMTENGKTYERL